MTKKSKKPSKGEMKSAFDSIMRSLQDVIAYKNGDTSRAIVWRFNEETGKMERDPPAPDKLPPV